MLAGLTLYLLASLVALFSSSFTLLMLARMMAAFGAAVGSIVTQTAIRDRFDGHALARVFSLMGIALAVSPALGVLSGTLLTRYQGYQGVFSGLAALAAALLAYSALRLPETRPPRTEKTPLKATLQRMFRDPDIWRSALLVALLNLCMFSYYQLAPFRLAALGFPQQLFGYSGMVLAAGVAAGAVLNRRLVAAGWTLNRLLVLAGGLSLAGGLLVAALWHSLTFVLAMIPVVMAYGIAIPNILAHALRHYRACAGTAGALLGMMYCLMLGAGLSLAGLAQHLGGVVTLCSLLILLLGRSGGRE